MSAGAGGAAAAAAAHQAKMREEEESLTTYNINNLDGWEFKIVRSATKIKSDGFRQLCEEENKNGWELVEKFDDNRIRFKRLVKNREQDAYAEIDPYRTHIGLTETKLVFIVLGVVFLIMIGIITLAITRGG